MEGRQMSMDPPKYKSPTVACLTVCALALAGSAWPAAGHEGALRFDRVTVEDGLSGPMVHAIHQDGQGFLWFGTAEGLERYDGYAFKVYQHDPEDPRSLSNHSVEAIYTDRSGTLWIGTATGGLNRYRRSDDAFVHYRHA
ncbi:MAG: hypothetical protein GY856_47330, partial [bacterium]|nr:hypothetical protein [bacterium]